MRDVALVVLGLSVPLLTWSVIKAMELVLRPEPDWGTYASTGAVLVGTILIAGTCYRIVRSRMPPNQYVLLVIGVLVWVAILA